jgi:hypothetical protein
MADLAVLFPEPRIVGLRGGEVSVLPLTMGQIPEFSRAINPAMVMILSGAWQAAIEDHGEAMQRAVAVATRQDAAAIAAMYPDDFLRLADAVLEVNLNFFGQWVMPQAAQVGQRLAQMLVRPGAISSPGSSGEATARAN